ncbi:MAG: hypothetical protein HZA50_08405 [Planctomycetes bacterium]|nr:hypothetical protein [Planctomycetota bacterium]
MASRAPAEVSLFLWTAGRISGITAGGGGDVPEAVLEGLQAAVEKQSWMPKGQKVVVLIGDAPPHKETMDKIKELVEKAVQKNFRFYCIKVSSPRHPESLTEFDQIASWGKGKSMWITFSDKGDLKPEGSKSVIVAGPPDRKSPYQEIFSQIMRDLMASKGYADRTDPFVTVLIESVESTFPERRIPFNPAPPPGTPKTDDRKHGLDGQKDPPKKPRDQ